CVRVSNALSFVLAGSCSRMRPMIPLIRPPEPGGTQGARPVETATTRSQPDSPISETPPAVAGRLETSRLRYFSINWAANLGDAINGKCARGCRMDGPGVEQGVLLAPGTRLLGDSQAFWRRVYLPQRQRRQCRRQESSKGIPQAL